MCIRDRYMTLFKKQMKRERNVSVDSLGYTMKVLIVTVIPVLLSTTIYNISSIIDQGVFKQVALLQGYSPVSYTHLVSLVRLGYQSLERTLPWACLWIHSQKNFLI